MKSIGVVIVIAMMTGCVSLSETEITFGVISDVHVGGGGHNAGLFPGNSTAARFAKALDWYNNETGAQAIAVVGDITHNGNEDEWRAVGEVLAGHLGRLRLVAVMGNHDAYPKTSREDPIAAERFERYTGEKVNADYVISGYHFIVINGGRAGTPLAGDPPFTPGETDNSSDEMDPFYGAIRGWAIERIEAAIAEDPGKPVFLFLHHPIKNTFYVSDEWYTATFGAGEDSVLNNYHQLVVFGGHIHSPNDDPRSIWQGGFTSVNTASLYYFEMETGNGYGGERRFLGASQDGVATSSYPKGITTGASEPRAEGMLVKARGSRVRIENYNFGVTMGIGGAVEAAGQVWEFDVARPGEFPYTRERREAQAGAPVFDPASPPAGPVRGKARVEPCGEGAVTVTFDQALIPGANPGGDIVHDYRFDFVNLASGEVERSAYQWSDFMDTPSLRRSVYTQRVGGLRPGVSYELRLHAQSALGKTSGQYLSSEFTAE